MVVEKNEEELSVAVELRKLRIALYVAVIVYVIFWTVGIVMDKALKVPSIAFP